MAEPLVNSTDVLDLDYIEPGLIPLQGCVIEGGTYTGQAYYRHSHLQSRAWDHTGWPNVACAERTAHHCEVPGTDDQGNRHVVYGFKIMQRINAPAWNDAGGTGSPCRQSSTGGEHEDWRWDEWTPPDKALSNLIFVARPPSGYNMVEADPEGDRYDADGVGELTLGYQGGTITIPFNIGGLSWYDELQQYSERSWAVSRATCRQTHYAKFGVEQTAQPCESWIGTRWRMEIRVMHWTGWLIGHWHPGYWGSDANPNIINHKTEPCP